jgi:hypothetical protein
MMKKKETLEEQIEYPSSLTKDLDSLKKGSVNKSSADVIKKEDNKRENVAEKGKGITPFQNHLCNNDAFHIYNGSKSKQGGGTDTKLEDIDNPETMVRDLETRNLERLGRKSLPPQAREILLLAASIHLREGKGLTVKHLQRSSFEKDNAEKVIQDARRNGLLVPGERREGKQKQYYEANYKHKIDAKSSNKRSKDALVPIDKDIGFSSSSVAIK